jgi:hypothetical protein
MAISIDWTGASATPPYKALITIPQSYLAFISGTLYELDTMQFWDDMKALEDDEDGIVFNDLQAHFADYTVAGTTYADAVFMLCEVTFENTGGNYSVRLVGSNNDIFDEDNGILVATPGLTIIPGNAAGLIIAETGVSGLTPQESQDLADIAADQATITASIASIDATLISQFALLTEIDEMEIGEHITSTTGKLIIRNTTAMRRWEALAWENEAGTIPYNGEGMEYVEQLVEVAWS